LDQSLNIVEEKSLNSFENYKIMPPFSNGQLQTVLKICAKSFWLAVRTFSAQSLKKKIKTKFYSSGHVESSF